MFVSGHYKVEMFDRNVNDYVPTVYGLGMHVEVTDPEDKTIMSRVRYHKIAPKHGITIPNTWHHYPQCMTQFLSVLIQDQIQSGFFLYYLLRLGFIKAKKNVNKTLMTLVVLNAG